MKLKYTLAGLALVTASCTKDSSKLSDSSETQSQATLSASGNSSFGVHKNLAKALKYVDTDGEFLSLSDSSKDMELTLEALTELEKFARAQDEGKQFPEDFHFTDVLTKTKLDQFRSVSSSSKSEGGAWTNKMFIDLNGTNEGIFSLLKGRAGQWGAYDFAPSGSDYVVEYDLNIENISDYLEAEIAKLDPKLKGEALKGIEEMKKEMGEFAFLLDGVHPRISMALKLNREGKIVPEKGIEFPDVNMVTRIEGLGQLFEKVETMLAKNAKKVEKDGVVYYHAPEEVPVPGEAEKLTPVIMVDKANDQIWIATRESFLEDCLSNGPKLKDDADFKKLMTHLSDSGNVFAYVSQDSMKFLKESFDGKLGKTARSEMKKEAGGAKEQELVDILFDKVGSRVVNYLAGAEGGFATTVDLNDEGLLISSRSPLPMKGGSSMKTMYVAGAMAAISSPIIIKQISKARATQAINNGKDIYVGLRDFNISTGKPLPGTPGDGKSSNEHFRTIFMAGYLEDEKPFYVKGVESAFEADGDVSDGNILEAGSNVYGYVPGVNLVTSDANCPLLISPLKKEDGQVRIDTAAFGGQVVIVAADGSAQALQVDEFGRIEGGEYSFKDGVITYTNRFDKKVSLQVALPE